MSRAPVATDRLDSWKAIASYIGRDVRTAIRWEHSRGLPVHRVPGGGRQVVFAYPSEIDAWLAGGNASSKNLSDPTLGNAGDSDFSEEALSQLSPAGPAPRRVVNTALAIRSHLKGKWLASIGFAAALAIAIVTTIRLTSQKKFLVASETQITNDAASKVGLVTDGRDLYFGERRGGRIVLLTVPVEGGPICEIPTPFVQTQPVAVSGDGRQLLVLAGEGNEVERALWILPVQGGRPKRIGNFLCHSAASSRDGRLIAIASGSSIFATADNGATLHRIQTFAGVPDGLQWSLDAKRLIFLVRNMATEETVPWKIEFSDTEQFKISSLVPLAPAPGKYDSLSPVLNNADDTFLGLGDGQGTIQVLNRSPWPWRSNFSISSFARELGGVGSLAADREHRELYLLKEIPGRHELDWFDRKSHEFRPFLPGISARDVDFSRDGRFIAFVQDPPRGLWVAGPSGNSARQIPTPGIVDIELPRWSPDGKEIAFMGKRADSPWRIYVSSADGTDIREASAGDDNQGAPTWSPDGRRLVYGRVFCQEEKTCAIGEIDLETGQQTVVQGSEGLSTARWSPDGKYIAALRAASFQVFLLDRRIGQWRKLADGVNGNDLAWAPDSKAIYASKPGGDRPEVMRISLPGGKAEPAVDLTSFSKLTGHIETWFAVTPDDSILFLHVFYGADICALHYLEKR